ncbi:protein kinase [Modestobacter sp. I12A-02628]|uniref:non-specific serine/threonine protein kinase n=2 Tax=Goekera deserti TaxID=2497753 RepID=A0A7K3WHV4_9ACTN|nr:protein kinase [Goekera deserti]NDI48443.1 protein kinase [Goekera deserti]NEL56044.1 serine/threonine protein kinase [Goekera deserti]
MIGRGGTSTVYRVTDPDGRVVALKLLDVEQVRSDVARARFHREFEIARELRHPHVIEVLDHGEAPARVPGARPLLWTTMEHVDGVTGSSLVPGPHAEPDLPRVLAVAGQVAGALDHAHARDVVHRDVKPSNVLVRAVDGAPWAVLTDFGIARFLDDARPLARNGRVLGSLPYAAPEVLQAQQLSGATDVYGLACTLVEWLTGRPPFPLPSPFAIVHAHLTRPPPELHRRRGWLPRALGPVVARALAKDPADRYVRCTEFTDLVAGLLSGVEPVRPAAEQQGRLSGWLGRRAVAWNPNVARSSRRDG